MINVTATAEEYLSELISKKDFKCDIRIFVSDPGTPRAETCLAFCKENESEPTDHRIKYENFILFIEEKSLPFLDDAEVNYDKDNFGGQLTIKAPNAIIREPNSAGCHIPFRSIQRPIKIPPTPAPNIIKEYANEGTQRSVSRSAAIGFNDTKSMFGAPRPMVLRIREQKITTQPYGVSMLSFG